jgi:hypothetical protein
VDVVEVHDAIAGNAILLCSQYELTDEPASGSGQRGDHHTADPIGHGVAC